MPSIELPKEFSRHVFSKPHALKKIKRVTLVLDFHVKVSATNSTSKLYP